MCCATGCNQRRKSLLSLVFGAAFKLGRHEWFVLRRLITNSRNSAFTRGFCNLFLKETSQVDGRTKNRPLHGTLRLKNSPTGEKIQNGRRGVKLQETQWPLDVAQNCFVLGIPLQLFLCWKFRNFLLRNKAFVYLLTYFTKRAMKVIEFEVIIGQLTSPISA